MSQTVAEISAALQALQRKRSILIKSRIMQANRLQAVVAGTMGYATSLAEKERKKLFKQADAAIRDVMKGAHHELEDVIRATMEGLGSLTSMEDRLTKAMEQQAARLPVAGWVEADPQRGFGLLSLATVVGEAGDLAGYANPGKLWRRFGLAPFQSGGIERMGATWKSGREGKLDSEEWSRFGYSPRRRSIAYVIGENIVKQNKGTYRQRYDEVRKRYRLEHPERMVCAACAGKGNTARAKCASCKATGQVALRCHRHAMLLATKLLLKHLWIQWNPGG